MQNFLLAYMLLYLLDFQMVNKQTKNPAYFGEFGQRVEGVEGEREMVMYIQSLCLKFQGML